MVSGVLKFKVSVVNTMNFVDGCFKVKIVSNCDLAFHFIGGLRGGMSSQNLDHQVWLRAAVIAVPICGLMILVLLIMVARRLLQSDDDYKDPDRSHHGYHRTHNGGGHKSSPYGPRSSTSHLPHYNFNGSYPSSPIDPHNMHLVKPVFMGKEPLLSGKEHTCCFHGPPGPLLEDPFALHRKNSSSEKDELVNNYITHYCVCPPGSESDSFSASSHIMVGSDGGSSGKFVSVSTDGTVCTPEEKEVSNSSKFTILGKFGLNKGSKSGGRPTDV